MTEGDRKEFKDLITEGFKAQRDWLEATLHPIRKDVDKHDLVIDKIPVIEQKIDTHLENHITTKQDKKFNIEIWLGLLIFIASQWIMYLKD